MLNNPGRYTDPTGHMLVDDLSGGAPPAFDDPPPPGGIPPAIPDPTPCKIPIVCGVPTSTSTPTPASTPKPPQTISVPVKYPWDDWIDSLAKNKLGRWVPVGFNVGGDYPAPPGITNAFTVGVETFFNWSSNPVSLGTMSYAGTGQTTGGGGSVSVYTAVILNADGYTITSPSDVYQVTVSVKGVGFVIANTVPDGKMPLTPGEPQTISVGWAPGARLSFGKFDINSKPAYGLCWGTLCAH